MRHTRKPTNIPRLALVLGISSQKRAVSRGLGLNGNESKSAHDQDCFANRDFDVDQWYCTSVGTPSIFSARPSADSLLLQIHHVPENHPRKCFPPPPPPLIRPI